MDTTLTRMLVIEDEPAHSEAICRAMEEVPGLGVKVVRSLRAFQDTVAAFEPHLVLMDLNLPDGRATEVLADPLAARAYPIIVMTSYGSEKAVVEVLKAGAFDYLVKSPETFTTLPHTLERLHREWLLRLEANQAAAELRETHRFYDQIIRCAQEGIIVYGPDLTYRVWNPYMEQLTGMPAEAVLGRHPRDVFPFLEKTGFLENLELILAGGPVVSMDFPFQVPATGARGWSSNTSGPLLNALGESIGVIATVRDLTEQRRLEGEAREVEAQRAKLEKQLQQVQKLESLGSLAGGVAHDMNNVLGAILSLASAHVTLQPAGSPAREAFETIQEAATRGGKMVQSLLTFARHQPAEERQVDLNAVLARDLALLEHTTLAKIRLVTDFDPELRPIIGDANALVSAFMNLCVNAVDAMPLGGVLTLRTRNAASGLVEVEIEDTGVGMPPEVLAKAMDPFFTTKETGKGTGLGLALVYSTVKAHHGQFDLHSVMGEGTRARMVFPSCEAADSQAVPAAEAPSSRPAGLRLLLVDDDELIKKSSTMLIEILGHSVVCASSGEEALLELQGGYLPDVVILDMNMPGLGGAGTLPRLRALCPEVPVLLATGRVDESAMGLLEAHSGVVLMAKPFSIADLQAHLDRINPA